MTQSSKTTHIEFFALSDLMPAAIQRASAETQQANAAGAIPASSVFLKANKSLGVVSVVFLEQRDVAHFGILELSLSAMVRQKRANNIDEAKVVLDKQQDLQVFLDSNTKHGVVGVVFLNLAES